MSEHTPAPTPNRAVYGFVFCLLFKILFIMYLIWVLCPKEWLTTYVLTCLPDRYWAVVMPIFFLTIFAIFVLVIYPSMGLLMTPKWEDIRTIKDMSTGEQNINKNIIHNLSNNIVYSKEKCYCHTGRKCKKDIFNTADANEYQNQKIPKLEDLDIINISKQMYLIDK